MRPVVTFMVSPRRYEARGRGDEEKSTGLGSLRVQAMDLQHKLQKPQCTDSLPWQQEILLTLKINKSLLFSHKTGACQCIGTEKSLVKNLHNHLFYLSGFYEDIERSHSPSKSGETCRMLLIKTVL